MKELITLVLCLCITGCMSDKWRVRESQIYNDGIGDCLYRTTKLHTEMAQEGVHSIIWSGEYDNIPHVRVYRLDNKQYYDPSIRDTKEYHYTSHSMLKYAKGGD